MWAGRNFFCLGGLGDGESRGAGEQGELGCNGDGMLRYAERETGSWRPEAISPTL